MLGLLVILTIITGLAIYTYWHEVREEAHYTQRIRSYYEADVKTLSANDVADLAPYFGFPLVYYKKHFATKSEFQDFYLRRMRNIKQKELRIDTIEVLTNSSNDKQTILLVRGSIAYLMRDGTTRSSVIRDRIAIDNATQRIVSVTIY